MEEKSVWKGNHAMAEAAIRAGFRFFGGYPITPASPFLEYMSDRMPEAGGVFIQGSAEVEVPCMLMGAAFGGKLALTATSGPGFALMGEGLSAMGGGRIPALIVFVNRTGAEAGSLPGTQDCYEVSTGSLGNGGMHAFVYGPGSMQEAVDMIYEAPTIMLKYSTPVIVLVDAMIAQMVEGGILMPAYRPLPENMHTYRFVIDRARQKEELREVSATPRWGPFPREGFDAQANIEYNYQGNEAMYLQWKSDEVQYETYRMEDAEYLIAAWGSPARFAHDAVDRLRDRGVKAGLFRPKTLFPFPEHQLGALSPSQVKGILCVEMAVPAQFYYDVKAAVDQRIPVKSHHRILGLPRADVIVDEMMQFIGEVK